VPLAKPCESLACTRNSGMMPDNGIKRCGVPEIRNRRTSILTRRVLRLGMKRSMLHFRMRELGMAHPSRRWQPC